MAKRAETVVLFLGNSEVTPGAVGVQMPSPPGPGPLVDFYEEVRPGGNFRGIPYAELKLMGPGRHEVPSSRFRRTK
jgi:hypothetical protein